ncbi:hypothetical protein C5L28_001029 [Lentilactobacillus parakefiri]|uniref:Uncharacterized protein n=1 Tax=Lentilactobacillus parakefiri TaxID=152332 RepID=A0A224VKC8_9LACO|nr:hypothetical protein B8W96_09110 [Lentilactobacillus parakefiri]TDG89808.1 hypothetical protein C5L28_001029 [Lentilactobacillus parakefiri]GAW73021.1 hypothetical protein LPKJCM_02154 [Lentilactobacillus parakefiri]
MTTSNDFNCNSMCRNRTYTCIQLLLFFALDSIVQSQSQEQLSRDFKNNGHNSTIRISPKRRINDKLRQSYHWTKQIHIKLLSNNQGSGDTVYYLAKVNAIKVQMESKVIWKFPIRTKITDIY